VKKKKKQKRPRRRMSRVFAEQWDTLTKTEKLGALKLAQLDVQINPVYTQDRRSIKAIALDFPADINPRDLEFILRELNVAMEEVLGQSGSGNSNKAPGRETK
jgi:hypothetical protein